MQPDPLHRYLLKFLLLSAFSFFVGTIHGMLQVMPPIRAWLDSIGSPYGGPGHMIDPLAHAHMNLVGGVVLLAMCVTFYLLPIFAERKIYSIKLVQHTFWWVSIGVYSFYIILMTFGIWEGLLLHSHPQEVASVHHYYSVAVAISGTVMAVGFCTFLANVILTMVAKPTRQD
ncbi:MAG: cytochrome oxidase [Gallionella sp.]|nr:cytochrome oxidase [Gallionella sp.]